MKRRVLKLALRNTQRNRRRSLLAVISIVAAMMLIVVMQGFLGGFMTSLVRNTTRNETGHVRISGGEFEKRVKFLPVTENFKDGSQLIRDIENSELAKEIKIITERITFPVILSNNGKTRAAVGISGDAEKEKSLLEMDKVITEGRYLRDERDIIIGYKMAEMLNYNVGDTIKVMAQGSDYALNMRKFLIVGLFNTGLGNLDKSFFQIGLKDAQRLLRMGNYSQQVIVMLNDHGKADRFAESLETFLDDETLTVKPWTQIGFAYGYVTMAETVYGIIFAIVAMMGAFIIGNIMMMVVMERQREIGIMKSMGFTPHMIQLLFLAEGVTLGTVGAIVGIVLALILISILNINGVDITNMMGGIDGLGFDTIVFLTIKPSNIAVIFGLGITVSTIVSYLPALRASKLKVVDSIRG